MGDHPLVCPPMPLAINHGGVEDSCEMALLSPNQEEISHLCPAKVVSMTKDQLFPHAINSFVLSTWGTELIEGCLHTKVLSLKPGTYLLEWSGACSLCTKNYCIPGVIQTQSTLRLKNTWQA